MVAGLRGSTTTVSTSVIGKVQNPTPRIFRNPCDHIGKITNTSVNFTLILPSPHAYFQKICFLSYFLGPISEDETAIVCFLTMFLYVYTNVQGSQARKTNLIYECFVDFMTSFPLFHP